MGPLDKLDNIKFNKSFLKNGQIYVGALISSRIQVVDILNLKVVVHNCII